MPSIAGSHRVISRPFLLYPLTTGYYSLYLSVCRGQHVETFV